MVGQGLAVHQVCNRSMFTQCTAYFERSFSTHSVYYVRITLTLCEKATHMHKCIDG